MWKEIKRKLFHLLGVIYVIGLIAIPRWTYIKILAGFLAMELAAELLRLASPRFNDWLMRKFGGLMREKEKRRLTGAFWMLAGMLGTVVLLEPVPLAASAMFYLLLGDTAASLIGMRIGGPHWPGSSRRLSGSAACFLMNVVIGCALLLPHYGWPVVLAGAAAATAAELGVAPLNDNFTIPVLSSLAFLVLAR